MATAAKNPFEKKAASGSTAAKTTRTRAKASTAKKETAPAAKEEEADEPEDQGQAAVLAGGEDAVSEEPDANDSDAEGSAGDVEDDEHPTTPIDQSDSEVPGAADDEGVGETTDDFSPENSKVQNTQAPTPAAPKSTGGTRKRRTAKQVEEDAEQERTALQAQIDELKRALSGKQDNLDVVGNSDRVIGESEHGGDVRVIGDGLTIANDDWRATKSGLMLQIGRASAQARATFGVPVSLVKSLRELLSHFDEIEEA